MTPKALQSFRDLVGKMNYSPDNFIRTTEPRHLKWLTVPKGHDLHVVAVADISYLRADNKYTTIATRASSFLCNSSLKEMKEKLREVYRQMRLEPDTKVHEDEDARQQ